MSENSIPEGFKMTEFGHLPKVWEVVRFGDKGQFQYGYTTSATDENTGTKFLRITDIKEDGIVNWGTVPYGSIDDNNLQKFRLSKGDILFARIGATTGKTCIIGGAIPNAVFASYLIRFVPDKELHPKYVFYFTQTREYQELVNAGKEGKLKKGLSATELKNFNIPLPPLPEQQKIADVLSTVQQAKEKTDAVISATNELKKSMMKHLFSYGPVPLKKFNELRVNALGVNELQNAQDSSNSKNSKNSINLKETEIGLVPEEWEVKGLGEVIRGTQYGISLRGNQEGQYPILRMNNLMVGHVDTSDLQYVDLDEDIFKKFLLNKGDILFNRTNSFELVGKTALFDLEDDFVFASYLIRVVSENSKLVPEYLNYYLNWGTTQNRLKMLASRGVSQSNINATKLRGFSIPCPPHPTQQKIASILSAVDKKIEAEATKKETLDVLFKSLLQNLMTGKLRVNALKSL